MENGNRLGYIEVRGARANNLQNINLDLKKHRLIVFSGLSGSGKSSLVFSTLAATAERFLNATQSAFVQGFTPALPPPEVDSLHGLTATLILDQSPLGDSPRSTLGTVTDAHPMLRRLFSNFASPPPGPPNALSFNVPAMTASGHISISRGQSGRKEHRSYSRAGGMCPRCEGLGRVYEFSLDKLIDPVLSLSEGALKAPGYPLGGLQLEMFEAAGVPMSKPFQDWNPEERALFLHGKSEKISFRGASLSFQGLLPQLHGSYLNKELSALKPHQRTFLEAHATRTTCPDCSGTRLNDKARQSLLSGHHIGSLAELELHELLAWLKALSIPEGSPLLHSLIVLIEALVNVGLGYLTLSRSSASLSGGEAQRVRLARFLHSPLTDLSYVFDEPTAGLHPLDVSLLIQELLKLRDKGNSLLVVSHDPALMMAADEIIELGPMAGSSGGQVVFQGSPEALLESSSASGRALREERQLRSNGRKPKDFWVARGLQLNNLKHIDVDLPLGLLVAITGLSGSGKSSLLKEVFQGRPEAAFVTQGDIAVNRRSTPATWTGLMDAIRKGFSKMTGASPSLFSSNSKGACEECQGAGSISCDLGAWSKIEVPCEACQGQGFNEEALSYRVAGKNIAELLSMRVEEALQFFKTEAELLDKKSLIILHSLYEVGLAYVPLGQPLTTLSGGERQRLKLAKEVLGESPILVLDEPTTGLHLQDISRLLGLFQRLVDSGRSIFCIAHHPYLISQSDWVLELGPEGGKKGGQVLYSGPLQAFAKESQSHTGKALRRYIEKAELK